MKHLLVDGDIFVYRAATANQQTFDWGEGAQTVRLSPANAIAQIDEQLLTLMDLLKGDKMTVCLTDSGRSFRKDFWPDYKLNRRAPRKGGFPELIPLVRYHLEEHYDVVLRDRLEADDCLGILATRASVEDRVVISDDKDLRQIPGKLYVPRTGDKLRISRTDADRFFYQQVLTGDSTDNYPGARRIGPKSPYVRAVSRRTTERGMWSCVLAGYRKVGGEPLPQARCARILRASDWDWKERRVIPWEPPE